MDVGFTPIMIPDLRFLLKLKCKAVPVRNKSMYMVTPGKANYYRSDIFYSDTINCNLSVKLLFRYFFIGCQINRSNSSYLK